MSDESKNPVSPEESAGSGEVLNIPEGAPGDAPSPTPAPEPPPEDKAKKSGGFDFLTILLVVVVLLNVALFLYNSTMDKKPAGPGGGPPPGAAHPPGDPSQPAPPGPPPENQPPRSIFEKPTQAAATSLWSSSPEVNLEVLTPDEEFKVILKGAQDYDNQNPRLLAALMALHYQDSPVNLSLQQRQRFLVEFTAKRVHRSVESIVAAQIGDVFQRLGLTPAKSKVTESPDETLKKTVAFLTRIQAKGSPKPFTPRDFGLSHLFTNLDEACVAILEVEAKGKEEAIDPSTAAELLGILGPVLNAEAPPLSEAQQAWIRENQGTELMSLQTWLRYLSLPKYDETALRALQEHAGALLAGH